MVFQWFCYHWTITIECFFTDWPLTSMVFQWFSPNFGTMVSNGFGPFKRTKKTLYRHISHFVTNELDDRERRLMNPHQNIQKFLSNFTNWRQNQNCLEFKGYILLPLQSINDFQRYHHNWMEWFGATIGFNGFSMVLGSGNHWFRWFSMVLHHRFADGMVTYHRWSLIHQIVAWLVDAKDRAEASLSLCWSVLISFD